MTTGNSAAMTMSVAAAKAGFIKTDCEELHKKNVDQREKVGQSVQRELDKGGLTRSKRKKLNKLLKLVRDGGMTFSSAAVNLPIGGGKAIGGIASGASSAKARERSKNALVEGGDGDAKTGGKGILCGSPKYRHPEGGAGGHAEAKIFNQVSEMASKAKGALSGGRVLFNVNWRYAQPDGGIYESGMPCRNCYRMMCHASKKCGIEIMLCDSNNEPVKFDPDKECNKKSKNPKDSPYKKLDERMKEHAYKGRRTVSAP
jgi:hypothetical protein